MQTSCSNDARAAKHALEAANKCRCKSDVVKGVALYERAIELGSVEAMIELGVLMVQFDPK